MDNKIIPKMVGLTSFAVATTPPFFSILSKNVSRVARKRSGVNESQNTAKVVRVRTIFSIKKIMETVGSFTSPFRHWVTTKLSNWSETNGEESLAIERTEQA